MPGFCPNHGPFDGNTCPFPPPHGSIGGRPENPSPLEDDDIPTEPPGGYRRPAYDTGEEPTEIPGGGRRGAYMTEGEEPTEYGIRERDDLDFTELEAPPTVTMALLWVREGRRRGRTYPIKHGTIIGRKEGDLILDDPKVSNMHAKFNVEEGDFVIWDFGSSNGTYVNGKKIRKATVLEENDLIKIGDTVFVVKLLEPRPKRRNTSTRKTAVKKATTRNSSAKKAS